MLRATFDVSTPNLWLLVLDQVSVQGLQSVCMFLASGFFRGVFPFFVSGATVAMLSLFSVWLSERLSGPPPPAQAITEDGGRGEDSDGTADAVVGSPGRREWRGGAVRGANGGEEDRGGEIREGLVDAPPRGEGRDREERASVGAWRQRSLTRESDVLRRGLSDMRRGGDEGRGEEEGSATGVGEGLEGERLGGNEAGEEEERAGEAVEPLSSSHVRRMHHRMHIIVGGMVASGSLELSMYSVVSAMPIVVRLVCGDTAVPCVLS